MKMNRRSAFLVDQARRYNSIDFIASDPISIPHRYDRKEDVDKYELLFRKLMGPDSQCCQASCELLVSLFTGGLHQ